MSDAKHTPGPWKIWDGWGSSRFAPVVVDCIPDVDGKFVGNCICHVAGTNEDREANARVIASAPEMLEALEYIRANCFIYCDSSMDIDNTACDLADRAIAKATGKTG